MSKAGGKGQRKSIKMPQRGSKKSCLVVGSNQGLCHEKSEIITVESGTQKWKLIWGEKDFSF